MAFKLVSAAMAWVLLASGLSACSKPSAGGGKGERIASASAAASAAGPASASADAPGKSGDGEITLATFAIRKFSKDKAAKPDVIQTLASVVRKYDVIAIQGIDDEAEELPQQFLAAVNQGASAPYEVMVSEPTGREKNDEHWRERYAFYYRTGSIDAYGKGMLYDDSADDRFPREPFGGRFGAKQGNFNFVLITVRTNPRSTLREMEALPKVIEWARESFPDESNFILLGDLNADCRHAMPEQMAELELQSSKYKWVVPDDSDSNVGEASCAYDRIIITEEVFRDYAGQWGVDRAFTDEAVSDRWPVWAKFHTDKEAQ